MDAGAHWSTRAHALTLARLLLAPALASAPLSRAREDRSPTRGAAVADRGRVRPVRARLARALRVGFIREPARALERHRLLRDRRDPDRARRARAGLAGAGAGFRARLGADREHD